MPLSSLTRHQSLPFSTHALSENLESQRRGAFADDECEIYLDGNRLNSAARGEDDLEDEDEELREFESLERKVSQVFQGNVPPVVPHHSFRDAPD